MATKFVETIRTTDANARRWLVENTMKTPQVIEWDDEEEVPPLSVLCYTNWTNEPIEVDVTKIQGIHIWGLDEYRNKVDFDEDEWGDGTASHLADYVSRIREKE